MFFLKEFLRKYPEYISEDNAMGFVSDDHGESFNLCHCECTSFSFSARAN